MTINLKKLGMYSSKENIIIPIDISFENPSKEDIAFLNHMGDFFERGLYQLIFGKAGTLESLKEKLKKDKKGLEINLIFNNLNLKAAGADKIEGQIKKYGFKCGIAKIAGKGKFEIMKETDFLKHSSLKIQ